MPQRIQRQRTAGWKMPANTIYVGRPTKYGNPYSIAEWLAAFVADRQPDYEDRLYAAAQVVHDFNNDLAERHAANPAELAAWLAPLRGKNLACWCKVGHHCHADTLLALANS